MQRSPTTSIFDPGAANLRRVKAHETASDPALSRAAAAQALGRGDYPAAERHALAALECRPGDGEAWLLAGIAAAETRRFGAAIARLEKAVAALPLSIEASAQLARCLSLTGQIAEACRIADRAMDLTPRDALSLDTLGVVYSRGHAHDKACAAFRAAIAQQPSRASYQFNLATSLKFLGDFDAAEQAYETCLALDRRFWKAHSGLAQLRRQTAASNHLVRLQKLLPAAPTRTARIHLQHALAKEYEDLGEYASAFRHLTAANAAKRSGYGYAFDDDAVLFDALEQCFATAEASPPPGCDSREPIFVIGMPRSGTTLVERILSSHPDVYSAGELQNFARVTKHAAGTGSREIADAETLIRALRVDPRLLGEAYLQSTRPATGRQPYFVDKMPMNFLYAGYIARALPNARIVALRRHPLDTILSNFRQLFSIDSRYYHYADDLLDCTRYVIRFERLMQHWRKVLPGRILEVRYESLIDAQEAETRRLLAFCGLDWHEACRYFERNTAPVATASAVQVRSPIHRGAVQRWKHYAGHLVAARDELLRAGIDPD